MPASLPRGRSSFRRVARAIVLVGALACAGPGCRRASTPGAPAPPPHPPPTTGQLVVAGLSAPVTVVRDTWGIPHISAASLEDLYFAQGFVQAQDRLFQMDLWRRAAQGRLAETLGANFVERDAMTRRFQFRGDLSREWAAYGPDARRIAVAFTSGINAWVALARADLPEEFVSAGWTPETWKPEDLLNRTDAFVSSGYVHDDLLRARLAAAVGPELAQQLMPATGGTALARSDVDLSAITFVLSETIRRMGTPAFFTALAAPVSAAPRPGQVQAAAGTGRMGADPPGAAPGGPGAATPRDGAGQPSGDVSLGGAAPSTPALAAPPLPIDLARPADAGSLAVAVAPARSATGAPLLALTQTLRPEAPSARYLVHLMAPGLNLIGATAPWMPGVLAGHNGHIAWGAVPAGLDTQDVFVERLDPANPHRVARGAGWEDMTVEPERIAVKGRAEPFEIERLYTSHGVVVGLDRARHLAYTLKWSGADYGTSSVLAALTVNRATTWTEFQDAVARWRMPAVELVYADIEDHVARVVAGAVPERAAGQGLLPAPGWNAAHAWRGIQTSRSVDLDPRARLVVAARGPASRAARLLDLLAAEGERAPADLRLAQLDVIAPGAATLLPLLEQLPASAGQDDARARLLRWDRRLDGTSPEAQLYAAWEDELARALARRHVPTEFVDDVAARLDVADIVGRGVRPWFEARGAGERDTLLLEALATATRAVTAAPPRVTFVHPLAAFSDGRRRFNVGPFVRPGGSGTVFASTERSVPVFRAVFDLSDWNRSMAMVTPGQSGSPASAHYDDLAPLWAQGEYVPLAYTNSAVQAAARDTLTLRPRQ